MIVESMGAFAQLGPQSFETGDGSSELRGGVMIQDIQDLVHIRYKGMRSARALANVRLLALGIILLGLTEQAHAMCWHKEIKGELQLCCPSQDRRTFSCTKASPSRSAKPVLSCTVTEVKGSLQECCTPHDRPTDRKCGRPGWSQMECMGPDDPKCFETSGPGTWDHARRNHLNIEVIPSLFGGARRVADSAGNASSSTLEAVLGFEAKVRLLYRWHPPGSATAKMLGLIPFFFIGNDFGLEVRAGTFGVRSEGDWRAGGYLAVKPAALLSFDRWRAIAVLNFIPEVGLRKVEGSPVALHLAARSVWRDAQSTCWNRGRVGG